MVNLQQRHQLFRELPDTSRVWIFQSVAPIDPARGDACWPVMKQFVQSWVSHGAPVRGAASVVAGHFMIIVADECAAQVGGCSGDALHRAVQVFGERTGLNWLDRSHIPLWTENQLAFMTRPHLVEALREGRLTDQDLMLDHTVPTLGAWREAWLTPIAATWLARFLPAERI
jgi:hypothetical protein